MPGKIPPFYKSLVCLLPTGLKSQLSGRSARWFSNKSPLHFMMVKKYKNEILPIFPNISHVIRINLYSSKNKEILSYKICSQFNVHVQKSVLGNLKMLTKSTLRQTWLSFLILFLTLQIEQQCRGRHLVQLVDREALMGLATECRTT